MTIYPVTLRRRQPFLFQPVLDGKPHQAVITWSLYAQRPRLNLYTQDGVLIVAQPLSGSPDPYVITSASYDGLRGELIYVFQSPHGYALGEVVVLTATNFAPANYNGTFEFLATGTNEVRRKVAAGYVAATTPGFVSQDINLLEGYFEQSRLVYRASSKAVEVTP